MKLNQAQLRRLVEQVVNEMPDPPEGTSLATRAPAAAAAEHPAIIAAVETMVGAMGDALSEQLGDEDMIELDQTLHTEFHNDLMEFVEGWMNTMTESHADGARGRAARNGGWSSR